MEGFPEKKQDNKVENAEEISIECVGLSIKSDKHPQNEDAIVADKEQRIFAVFDGMGGHRAGEIASQMAHDYITANSYKIKTGTSVEEAKETFENMMKSVDREIHEAELEKNNDMGTTASVLKIHTDDKGKNWGLISNAGDSRIYKINKERKIEQITVDDDAIQIEILRLQKSLMEEKGISLKKTFKDEIERYKKIIEKLNKVRNRKELTELESLCFNIRNQITNYLGKNSILINVSYFPIEKEDRFLITSDGIHDNLTTEEIEKVIQQTDNLEDVVLKLTQDAYERSQEDKKEAIRAKPDDMSAVVIAIN